MSLVAARDMALWVVLCVTMAGCSTAGGPDPYQSLNRGIFRFNEGVDRYLLEPAAKGWDWALPEAVQDSVGNFFDNLSMPMVLANDLLQGKPGAAAQDLGRLLVNTTAGVAGLFDVASRIEFPKNDEDFGQTLGVWGIPGGPYILLPLLGPFTLRDALAYPVDVFSRPHVYFVSTGVSLGGALVDTVNLRAKYLEEIRENRETSMDYYVFVRDAYLQNREKRVRDGADPLPGEDDDLYYLEDEDELSQEDRRR